MKNLWKELVNSLGFTLSVLVVMLLIPMAFTFVMGALGDAETVGGLIFSFLIVGIPVIFFLRQPTQQQKEEKLWREEKKAEPRPKTMFSGKPLETSVEQAERLDVRKREHFERLPSQLYWKYKDGVKRKNLDYTFNLKCDIYHQMKKRKEFSYMFTSNFFYPEKMEESMNKRYGHIPYLILEGAINEHLKFHCRKDRDYLENNQKEKLEDMRWAANYVALAGVYSYNQCFSVSLSSDMKEYTIRYPFGVSPLKYQFDCTEQEEEQFFQDALQRIEDCKIIVDTTFKKGLYRAQNKLFAENNIHKDTVPNFNWTPNVEAWYEEMDRKTEEEKRNRREAEKYERET